MVTETWRLTSSSQSATTLRDKILAVGARLSTWGKLFGRETRERITTLERSLLSLNQEVLTGERKERELKLKAELTKLITQEEIFWKQRSKDLWLKVGDCNSSFFHAKANRRHHNNSIQRLKKDDGTWGETKEEVQQIIVDYFENMFKSNRPHPDDIQRGVEHLSTVVDEAMATDLQRPFTEEEVSKALSCMSPLKSPGPDGRKQFLNLKLDISKAYDRVEWCFLERVLESFSSLFRHAEANRVVSGVPICRGAPAISHLLFADDTMIFCPASQSTVQHVQEILASYKQASGQAINLQKSSVAFSRNTPPEVQRHLAEVLGIRLENKQEKYLGLPSMAFRSKRALFASLKDRIWKRIHGWHEKTLSQASKAILIQSVVQAIPSDAMSCFRLPKTLLKEFQSLAADFFWHDGDRRPQVGNRPSFTWRSIIAARELLKSGCRWRIGTGHSVDVWKDPWIPRPASFRIITPNVHNVQNMCVSNLISPITREWDVDTINALLWPVDREAILQIPLSTSGGPDLLIWHYSNNGLFSVRSAYHLALSSFLASNAGTSDGRPRYKKLWKSIWQAKVPSKAKLFIWRAIRNALPTAANLRGKMPHEEIVFLFAQTRTKQSYTHSCIAVLLDRNLKMLNKGFLFPQQIVDFARTYLNAFVVQNFGQFSPRPAHNHFWQAPYGNCIKINFNGALLEGGKVLGLGVVARNSLGVCVAWCSIRLERGGPAFLAETLAVREAIRLACRKARQNVTIEGDCASLLSKISRASQDRSVFGPLIFDIVSFAAQIETISYSFVFRSGNSVAHSLARLGLNLEGDCFNVPPGVNSLLTGDFAN
ncbi:UNVERIFIED_CONTAM: putative ribonuclease H protein [Sesamum angustifolium]|uniref:Ribonuclease H protein n=1 Tax=Sesamum angustifolium TaxID=2727405 RepID=A0AAW2KWU7_9LAMI